MSWPKDVRKDAHRAPIEQLKTAYLAGGYEAALAVELEHGAPSRAAARNRLVCLGIYVPGKRSRDWTKHEEQLLVTLWNSGLAAPAIGERLNRTAQAVRLRRRELVGIVARRRRKWTPGQCRVVDESLDQLVAHLCARLDRTPGAIGNQIIRAVRHHTRRQKARSIAA